MAYDKIIDSTVLDGDLTSVADAIREKSGSTESLEFPQGFVEAIAGISAGGGDLSGINITKVECGTFTPASNSKTVSIDHSLGMTPKVILVYTEEVSENLNTTDVASLTFLLSAVMTDSNNKNWNAKFIAGKGNVSWSGVSNIGQHLKEGEHSTNVSNYSPSGISRVSANNISLEMKNTASGAYVHFIPVTYKWLLLA